MAYSPIGVCVNVRNMRKIFLLFLVLFLLLSNPVSGQNSVCDSIYNLVDTQPQYKNGSMDLLKYVSRELVPIINTYEELESMGKIRLVLIIDKNGKVVDAHIKNNFSQICKDTLINKILNMEGWLPAQYNNIKVCAEYVLAMFICLE